MYTKINYQYVDLCPKCGSIVIRWNKHKKLYRCYKCFELFEIPTVKSLPYNREGRLLDNSCDGRLDREYPSPNTNVIECKGKNMVTSTQFKTVDSKKQVDAEWKIDTKQEQQLITSIIDEYKKIPTEELPWMPR